MSQNVRFSGGAGGGDPQPNVINNPVATALSESGALPSGSFIITGGMYGSNQERILIHTGGLPSAPPSASQPQRQQLSPVFILPPPQQPTTTSAPTATPVGVPPSAPHQCARNMTMATSGNTVPSAPQKNLSPPTYSDDDDLGKTSISLPSFGGSFDCLSQNGNGKTLHTPLLSELPPMISRTPLPVIGGRYNKVHIF